MHKIKVQIEELINSGKSDEEIKKILSEETVYLNWKELPEEIKQSFWEGFDAHTLIFPIQQATEDKTITEEAIERAIDNSWVFDEETVSKNIVDEKGKYSILGDMLVEGESKNYLISVTVDIDKNNFQWSEENVDVNVMEELEKSDIKSSSKHVQKDRLIDKGISMLAENGDNVSSVMDLLMCKYSTVDDETWDEVEQELKDFLEAPKGDGIKSAKTKDEDEDEVNVKQINKEFPIKSKKEPPIQASKRNMSLETRIRELIDAGKTDEEIKEMVDIEDALDIVMYSDVYPSEFFKKFEKIKIVYSTSKDGEEAKSKAYEKAEELKKQGWTVKVKKVKFRDLARATAWFVYGVRYKLDASTKVLSRIEASTIRYKGFDCKISAAEMYVNRDLLKRRMQEFKKFMKEIPSDPTGKFKIGDKVQTTAADGEVLKGTVISFIDHFSWKKEGDKTYHLGVVIEEDEPREGDQTKLIWDLPHRFTEMQSTAASLKASQFTRMAQTDKQEAAIVDLEKWAKQLGVRLSGGTTIGKAPQTVIIDINHQDSAIYIDRNGSIETFDAETPDFEGFRNALKDNGIEIKAEGHQPIFDFTHLLDKNKEYTLSEYAELIAKNYDVANPKTKAVYDELMANTNKKIIYEDKQGGKWSVVLAKIKAKEISEDEMEEMQDIIENKFSSGIILNSELSNENIKKLVKMIKSKQYKFKEKTYNANRENADDKITESKKKMKADGWKIFHETDNMDSYYILFYKSGVGASIKADSIDKFTSDKNNTVYKIDLTNKTLVIEFDPSDWSESDYNRDSEDSDFSHAKKEVKWLCQDLNDPLLDGITEDIEEQGYVFDWDKAGKFKMTNAEETEITVKMNFKDGFLKKEVGASIKADIDLEEGQVYTSSTLKEKGIDVKKIYFSKTNDVLYGSIIVNGNRYYFIKVDDNGYEFDGFIKASIKANFETYLIVNLTSGDDMDKATEVIEDRGWYADKIERGSIWLENDSETMDVFKKEVEEAFKAVGINRATYQKLIDAKGGPMLVDEDDNKDYDALKNELEEEILDEAKVLYKKSTTKDWREIALILMEIPEFKSFLNDKGNEFDIEQWIESECINEETGELK